LRDVRPNRIYEALYGLPAAELEDLAYYFEYEDPARIDPEPIRRVSDLVRRWKSGEAAGALVGFREIDGLLIWDTRPVARGEWTRLRGLHREIALHCDA